VKGSFWGGGDQQNMKLDAKLPYGNCSRDLHSRELTWNLNIFLGKGGTSTNHK